MRNWITLKGHHAMQAEMFVKANRSGRWEQTSAPGPRSLALPFNHALVSRKHTLGCWFPSFRRACLMGDHDPPLWIIKSNRSSTLLSAGKDWASCSLVKNPHLKALTTSLCWMVNARQACWERKDPTIGNPTSKTLVFLGKEPPYELYGC